MKKVLIVFIAISLISLKSKAQEDGTVYTSENGNYSILTFGDFSESAKEDDIKTTYKITYSHDDMYYLLSSTIHQSSLENNIDDLIDVSLASFKESIKGEIKEEKEVYLNDVKGKYALFGIVEDTFKLEYFVYMKGDYQYQFVMYAKTELYNNEEAALVLSSLLLN